MKTESTTVMLIGGLIAALTAGLGQLTAQTAPPPAPGGAAHATDGRVWGAVIYATDSAEKLTGVKTPEVLVMPDLEKKLAKVFPFTHFEILGQHTQDLLREYESWVVPSTDLFLKLDSNGPAEGGGINVHLQFWRQEQVIIKTDALLRPRSPLFISGPKWRDGQLLFVLLLTEQTTDP